MTMALALEQELPRLTACSQLDSPFPSRSSSYSSIFSTASSVSSPATSISLSPCPSPKIESPESPRFPEQSFSFLDLPPEIRTKIYHFALSDTTIHICSPTLRRRRGGPNRTKKLRRLPGILSVNKEIRSEALPLLAHHSTLAFSDFFNFSHLLSLVPEHIACLARKIALQGDVILTPELVERFPCLEEVQYTQLGNCVYAPIKENGFNAYASTASNAELVESVKARSASLVLLKGVLGQVNERRKAAAMEKADGMEVDVGEVQLVAVANVLSSRQRVSLTINVSKRRVTSRDVVAEGHFFD